MKKIFIAFAGAASLAFCSMSTSIAQTAPAAPSPSSQQPGQSSGQRPLQLNSVGPPPKLQFPAPDPKNFTAQSPTAQEVNGFLKQLWGYDPNRVWQVEGVQSTAAPNVSRVIVYVGEQGVSHTPSATVFFVTPDGKHAIAGSEVIDFGQRPFEAVRQKLEQGASGPYRGSKSKNLMLVEFADLECPHCKEAAPIMARLAQDFPTARVVFENFPLTNVHPAAEKAAAYGVCVAQEKGNDAFFQYTDAVFATQAGLTSNADQTLKDAAVKAGANATTAANCAETAATKAAVDQAVKLGQEIGVNQTPLLFVNGRSIPVAGVPYNTLKQIVSFEETQGSSASAQAAPTLGPTPPTLQNKPQ